MDSGQSPGSDGAERLSPGYPTVTEVMSTNRNVYQRTADRLRLNGWSQNAAKKACGSMCLLQALLEERATPEEMAKVGREIGEGMAGWNDHPDRTVEDVLHVLIKVQS